MNTYVIPVEWTMRGELEIKANSLSEALDKAYEEPTPYPGQYVDDSFSIDVEGVEIL